MDSPESPCSREPQHPSSAVCPALLHGHPCCHPSNTSLVRMHVCIHVSFFSHRPWDQIYGPRRKPKLRRIHGSPRMSHAPCCSSAPCQTHTSSSLHPAQLIFTGRDRPQDRSKEWRVRGGIQCRQGLGKACIASALTAPHCTHCTHHTHGKICPQARPRGWARSHRITAMCTGMSSHMSKHMS